MCFIFCFRCSFLLQHYYKTKRQIPMEQLVYLYIRKLADLSIDWLKKQQVSLLFLEK
jgi:hypothetical protein